MKSLNTNPRLSRDFPPDAPYLIGVSGGRDSVALLHWLIGLGYEKLIVCHLNHQLRGRSSEADARLVKKLAAKYQLDFELGTASVRALAKKRRTSIETAAREARYSFFAKVAQRRRCHTIFLAHHADDLVETFLFNLIRGAGLTGLAGMRQVSTRDADDFEMILVRPFLSIWRKEIDCYVTEHRLYFHEDASNKNLAPMRNRIRHRVMPYLERMLGRTIRQNIWRTSIIAGDEETWMNDQLPNSTGAQLSVAGLRALPVALQRRAILKWLRAQNISDLGFEIIERVRSLIDSEAGVAKVNLPQDRHARRRAGNIFVE
ncbi:MAG TPA: tRNA lysidine(34) synthetase TilS [Candidatus Udaeobacter sp.]|nr:tRNA lysidine(34) synthetase TilS [Candidatus Udaeobacter sp.]